ncbi:MAG: 2-amino-4-hydroxy-6-hydroxymethyldihydropteridine diphosphokinase, partial [Acidimicrobiia bacterium]|nr:2-amino-4-hydroxy-6-hydroxymethyldihydropteridine diphosphokinase [Acidimicrobiia bacterium]
MSTAVIALGSNLGDRRATLRSAVNALSGLGHVAEVSSLYETEPIGGPEQGPYFNAVVVLETDLDPHRLLRDLHGIESAHGRERRTRWEARTLDLDLILFDDVVIDGEGVIVPHPRATERRFVLEPLVEVLPDAEFPDGTRAADALAATLDQELDRHGHDNWWRHGFASRGGWWVVGQVVGIGAWVVAAVLDRARFEGPAIATIGTVLFLAGVVLAWMALRGLGRNLTPFPEPMRSSELVRTGIYGKAR